MGGGGRFAMQNFVFPYGASHPRFQATVHKAFSPQKGDTTVFKLTRLLSSKGGHNRLQTYTMILVCAVNTKVGQTPLSLHMRSKLFGHAA